MQPHHTLIAGTLVLLMLTACASGPAVLRYDVEVPTEPRVWPQSPEIPRVAYVGTLIGEKNFQHSGTQWGSGFKRTLAWIAGLGQAQPATLVLERPQSGMVDSQGRVLVTDVSRQAVFVFDAQAGKPLVWSQADQQRVFKSPMGIVELGNQQIWVADADLALVARLDAQGRPLGSVGEGVLQRPVGLAFDSESGLVYVVDAHAHDVKMFDTSGHLKGTIGRRGEQLGEFNFPTYATFSGGFLHVTDTLNARIQVFDRRGDVQFSFGQLGRYVGNLVRPKGVARDSDGNLYVIESFNDHVLIYSSQGDFLLPIGGTGYDVGQFFLPSGIWTDQRDRIYVADAFNGRVVVFQYLKEQRE